MFLSLKPPFKPLSANSIGRITKQLLEKMGVPVSLFGAHSTRGAAVKMFKKLGLSSEIVCELGQWKNTEAFAKHYLRIGAAQVAGSVLAQKLVHRVPSCSSDEPGGSSSPGTRQDPGRRDPPHEAQGKMTFCFKLRMLCCCFWALTSSSVKRLSTFPAPGTASSLRSPWIRQYSSAVYCHICRSCCGVVCLT